MEYTLWLHAWSSLYLVMFMCGMHAASVSSHVLAMRKGGKLWNVMNLNVAITYALLTHDQEGEGEK